jgi:hypothetical protein
MHRSPNSAGPLCAEGSNPGHAKPDSCNWLSEKSQSLWRSQVGMVIRGSRQVRGIQPSYSAWKSANFRNVFKSRSDILQLSGRLRSLGNFSLSEWLRAPCASFSSHLTAANTSAQRLFLAPMEIRREVLGATPVSATRHFRPTHWHPPRAGTEHAPKASRRWRRQPSHPEPF